MPPTGINFPGKLESGVKRAGVPHGATLIVAFSGGPDSSALLVGLSELRERWDLTLVAVHVNHMIRPEGSDRDKLASEQAARRLGVEFAAVSVDVPQFARKTGISIETAARELRYRELSRIVGQRSALGVVTGHTLDDQAETVLLHAARGAGLKGIAGMLPRSVLKLSGTDTGVTVLRPMLGISKVECRDYCEQNGIPTVTDETNFSREYTRNRIRLGVLPSLEEAVTGSTRALARLAENAASDLAIVDWAVARSLAQASIDEATGMYSRASVVSLPRPLVGRVLMRAYADHTGHSQDLERTHVASMVDHVTGRSGTSVDLPNGVVFFVDRDSFGFRSGADSGCPYPAPLEPANLKFPGTTPLGGGFSMIAGTVARPAALEPDDPWTTYASPTALSTSPGIRNRRKGDRFQPLGMEPHVKLQDFFVGAGVPERWRDRVPLVESDRGIVWVTGSRLADWAKVRPEHGQVVRLELVRP